MMRGAHESDQPSILYTEQQISTAVQPLHSSEAFFSLAQDIVAFAIPEFLSGEPHSIIGYLNRSALGGFQA